MCDKEKLGINYGKLDNKHDYKLSILSKLIYTFI